MGDFFVVWVWMVCFFFCLLIGMNGWCEVLPNVRAVEVFMVFMGYSYLSSPCHSELVSESFICTCGPFQRP